MLSTECRILWHQHRPLSFWSINSNGLAFFNWEHSFTLTFHLCTVNAIQTIPLKKKHTLIKPPAYSRAQGVRNYTYVHLENGEFNLKSLLAAPSCGGVNVIICALEHNRSEIMSKTAQILHLPYLVLCFTLPPQRWLLLHLSCWLLNDKLGVCFTHKKTLRPVCLQLWAYNDLSPVLYGC